MYPYFYVLYKKKGFYLFCGYYYLKAQIFSMNLLNNNKRKAESAITAAILNILTGKIFLIV